MRVYWKNNLPITLSIPRKKVKAKKVNLNFNDYRNLHWGSESENKKFFAQTFGRMDWGDFDLKPPFKFFYFIHIPKDIADLMNVGTIIDKYLCDTLVILNLIKDDNITILNRCEFVYDYTIEKGSFDFCIVETASLPDVTILKKELNYEKH